MDRDDIWIPVGIFLLVVGLTLGSITEDPESRDHRWGVPVGALAVVAGMILIAIGAVI